MLQSCAPLLVVNVDAGFVAGACAAKIATLIAKNHPEGQNDGHQ
jgi:pyridinium-3,5-biscarboxylic acid mononucleotide synthase